MSERRRLTLGEFFDRIESDLRFAGPAPRRRIVGDFGVMIWRRGGVRAGIRVDGANGAFVFLGGERVPVDAATEAAAILRAIFTGEVVEVQARGPVLSDVWLGTADAPSQALNRYGYKSGRGPSPIYTQMSVRIWPAAA